MVNLHTLARGDFITVMIKHGAHQHVSCILVILHIRLRRIRLVEMTHGGSAQLRLRSIRQLT